MCFALLTCAGTSSANPPVEKLHLHIAFFSDHALQYSEHELNTFSFFSFEHAQNHVPVVKFIDGLAIAGSHHLQNHYEDCL